MLGMSLPADCCDAVQVGEARAWKVGRRKLGNVGGNSERVAILLFRDNGSVA